MKSQKLITLAYSILISNPYEANLLLHDIVDNIARSFKKKILKIDILFSIQGDKSNFNQLKKMFDKKSNYNIEIFYSGKKGISKSRNRAIQKTKTRFIHFLDSDCRFNFSHFELVDYFKKINTRNNIIFLVSSKISYKRNKSLITFFNLEQIFKIHKSLYLTFLAIRSASYQMILSKDLFYKYDIWFDTNLGLGSKLYQTEENCLILKFIKSPAKLNYELLTVNSFSAISKSHDYINKRTIAKQLISKGYVLGEILPRLGFTLIPFLSFIFYIKFRKQISIIKSINLVYKGYIRNY